MTIFRISRTIVLLLMCLSAGLPLHAGAEYNCDDVSGDISHGGILWTESAVVVQGTASPGLSQNKAKSLALIKQMTKRAATIDAYRKLAAVLSGVRVTSDSFASDNPNAVTKINAFVRQAKTCKTKFYKDGGVDIVVMVPLSASFSIDQLTAVGTDVAATESIYTGLIIDASDVGFAPALVPRIIAPDGSILFDQKKIKKEIVIKRGSVIYAGSPETIEQGITGSNPLKIRAVGLGTQSPSDIVIGAEAAEVLSNSPGFLGDGKIVILIDSSSNIDCSSSSELVKDPIIDWEKRLVIASGTGKLDFDRKLETATKLRMMERAAEVDSKQNLQKAFSLIDVDAVNKLKDLPGTSGDTMGVIVNAFRCDARYFKDGTAEVVTAVPIDGMGVKGANLGTQGTPLFTAHKSSVTGVIIDAGKLNYKPVLGPTLLAPDGTELFGPNTVARAYVEHYGVTGYRSSINKAESDKRVGNSPAVIRAVNVSKNKGQLVLNKADAEKIIKLKGESGVLMQGRVIIVTENTITNYLDD